MTAENPETPVVGSTIPHIKVVVSVTFFVLICFSAVSVYILSTSKDGTIVGAIIGTWTTMATSAGAFWLGASSGGKLSK